MLPPAALIFAKISCTCSKSSISLRGEVVALSLIEAMDCLSLALISEELPYSLSKIVHISSKVSISVNLFVAAQGMLSLRLKISLDSSCNSGLTSTF